MISFNSLHLRRMWHTVCSLQLQQIYYQMIHHLWPGDLDKTVHDCPQIKDISLIPVAYQQRSYLENRRFLFLNQEYDLGRQMDWSPSAPSKLWRYNLHYFNYLHQPRMDYNSGMALIDSWIKGYPARHGADGWEPYPLSLRIVNWIKFFSRWGNIPEEAKKSLLLQTINLARQIEYHIGGNHLWANGKSLWFAGIFLKNPQYAEIGRKIILKEIDRQFLRDGGHFELSPMYQAILTEDLLDLINLCINTGPTTDEQNLPILQKRASNAMGWLEALIDRKGFFPLLNDAAYGIARSYEDLVDYAQRLGMHALLGEVEKLIWANGLAKIYQDTGCSITARLG